MIIRAFEDWSQMVKPVAQQSVKLTRLQRLQQAEEELLRDYGHILRNAPQSELAKKVRARWRKIQFEIDEILNH